MITEQEAVEALPPHGWLRDYVVFASRQTTSPLAYHLGTGVTCLAVTCPLNYGSRYAGILRPNIYTLLVGRSGEDQKTSAIEVGREILFQAAPSLIGDHPGSWEGLVDSLARQPAQLLIYKEYGKFLAQSQRGYLEPLKSLLTDLWDASPQQRTKANNQTVRVDDPRLSSLGACSIPYLERHTDPHDWTGGFMGRWCVIYARRERTNPDPVGDTDGQEALVEGLRARSLAQQAPQCLGLDTEASQLWADWFHDVDQRKLPDIIAGVRTRAPAIARKTAMIYSWDFGAATGDQPFHISVDVLLPAIKFAEMHLKSVIALAGQLAEHPDAVIRRQVILAFGGVPRSLGDILGITKMRQRVVAEILSALVLDGTLTKMQIPGGSDVVYCPMGG